MAEKWYEEIIVLLSAICACARLAAWRAGGLCFLAGEESVALGPFGRPLDRRCLFLKTPGARRCLRAAALARRAACAAAKWLIVFLRECA